MPTHIRVAFLLVILGLLAMAIAVIWKSPEPETAPVTASWYGEELRDSPTASGEPFDPDRLTAAHKTLPLGTILTVCDDACTDVRINDRGPFTPGRDLDLSKAAAEKIGLEGVEAVSLSQKSEKPVTQLPKTGGI